MHATIPNGYMISLPSMSRANLDASIAYCQRSIAQIDQTYSGAEPEIRAAILASRKTRLAMLYLEIERRDRATVAALHSDSFGSDDTLDAVLSTITF